MHEKSTSYFMLIQGFVWIDSIIYKLASKHAVSSEEVEEIFRNKPWLKKGPLGHRPGENGYYALGKTFSGRCLFVFFILKKNKKALVITARDMTKSERKLYEKRK